MSSRPIEFLKSVFGGGIEKKSIPLSDSIGMEAIFGTPRTFAGPAINAATALHVPAVFSAVALLSGAIGSLPLKVFHSSPSGKRAATDHPAYRLVHDEANDWTSAGALRATLTADALLHDHGFAYANRINERVVEFIRLDPRTVTIKQDEATSEPIYEQRIGTQLRRYGYREILHISAPLGIAPIKAGREAIGLAKAMEQHAASVFSKNTRPSGGILKSSKKIGDDGKLKIASGWNTAFGPGGAGGVAVLDEEMSYQPLDAMTSADAEFSKTRAEQVVEIARLFRIPPSLLFELSRATWSNAEEMFQAFLTLTLRPWLDAWEWAYARVLLTPEERTSGYYVEFVVDDLLTADAETRATVYGQYRSMGVITANEVRAGLNRAPMDGGDTLENPNITPGKPAGQNDNGKPKGEAA